VSALLRARAIAELLLGRTKSENVQVYGKHIVGNLYDVDERLLSNEEFLRQTVVEAATIANMHVVDVRSWRFYGNDKEGVSVIALVIESHIALHTWPRYRYATLDVYTCGAKSDAERAFDYIIEKLKPRHYTKAYLDRSCRMF